MIPIAPPPDKSELHEYDYQKYKHLPGMPQEIPELTHAHWMAMIIPTVLLIILYIHHRDASIRDQQEEQQKTLIIEYLLIVGMVFASIVVMVQVQVIPVRVVRIIWYKWKQPPPMSPIMKILIIFCLFAFIIYPTAKFLRKRTMVEGPKVHKLVMSN